MFISPQHNRVHRELHAATTERDSLRASLDVLHSTINSDSRVVSLTTDLKAATLKVTKLEAELLRIQEESEVYRVRIEQIEASGVDVGALAIANQEERLKEEEGRKEKMEKMEEKIVGLEAVSCAFAFAGRRKRIADAIERAATR